MSWDGNAVDHISRAGVIRPVHHWIVRRRVGIARPNVHPGGISEDWDIGSTLSGKKPKILRSTHSINLPAAAAVGEEAIEPAVEGVAALVILHPWVAHIRAPILKDAAPAIGCVGGFGAEADAGVLALIFQQHAHPEGGKVNAIEKRFLPPG